MTTCKVLPNNKNIFLKIITYNRTEDELDIKRYPIIGWKIQECDHDFNMLESIPILPAGISYDLSESYYEWNKSTFNSQWELVKYSDIKNKLLNIGVS